MAKTLLDSPYIPPDTVRRRVHAIRHARGILYFDWSDFAVNEILTGNACPEVVHAQTDANRERDYVSLVFRNGVGSGNEEWRGVWE